jgi:ATP-dependent DNA helicase RecQ
VKVLTLRYSPSLGGFDDRPLSEFVRDKEVLAVREHFFSVHDLPYLACLVTYQDSTVAPGDAVVPPPVNRRRGDGEPTALLETLSPEDRVLFGTLRERRSSRARKDGLPPHVVFTNRELLAIVKAKPRSASALGAIDGIGTGRVERYGRQVLDRLHGQAPSAPPASAPGPTPPAAPPAAEAAP